MEKEYAKDSENWKTYIRKKMLSLLLYVFNKLPQVKKGHILNFFDLWKIIYPFDPLP